MGYPYLPRDPCVASRHILNILLLGPARLVRPLSAPLAPAARRGRQPHLFEQVGEGRELEIIAKLAAFLEVEPAELV